MLFDNLNFCTGEYVEPGENISLLFYAKVIAEGIGINLADVTACMCGQCDWQECSDTATINASNVIEELIADASGSPTTIVEGESVSFTGSATGGILPYNWLKLKSPLNWICLEFSIWFPNLSWMERGEAVHV